MLFRWPILYKLLFGGALLSAIVLTLAVSGFQGGYAYRSLARSISQRAQELPLATVLAQHISNLRVTLSETRGRSETPMETRQASSQILREEFRNNLANVHESLRRYKQQLENNRILDERFVDNRHEWQTVHKMERTLQLVEQLNHDEDWMLDDIKISMMIDELDILQQSSAELPSFLHDRISQFASGVRTQYRTWIVLTWCTSLAAAILLAIFANLFYRWIFRPLRILIDESRRVAGGDFDHRILLTTHDEMAELAEAMNAMTTRFQNIKSDLDDQVQVRTRQVVQSEKMASVGFLAAGVAHEINNPLASIAFSAESLESRLGEIIQKDDVKPDDEHNEDVTIARDYLRMIQDEAFRCKEITEKLLDFSRIGEVAKQSTDLSELVQGVIDMVRHVGKYREKHINFQPETMVWVMVNPQEIKQVVLNLITNGLDSLEPGGHVDIELTDNDGQAAIAFCDNGCGMTEEVLQHLFEPFFTRRRDGQGTGLGMSISYRIIHEHGGQMDARSAGPGKGSQVRVILPLAMHQKEPDNRYQAA